MGVWEFSVTPILPYRLIKMGAGKIIFGVGATVALAYTVAYFIRNAKLLKETAVRLDGVKINSFGEQVSLTVKLRIENKSDIPFTLHNASLEASINGLDTTEINVMNKEKVKARTSTVLPLHVVFNYKNAINNLKAAVGVAQAQGFKAVNIGLIGNLTVSSGILLFSRIPVDVHFNAGDFINQ